MNSEIYDFFKRHGYENIFDPLSYIEQTAEKIMSDMENGLMRKGASQNMILTHVNPPKEKIANETVIVIDAGGTNFRSCLVSFDENSDSSISCLQKTKMPGTEKELSKKEFFDQISENLEHLKDKASKIGFCFSYPMEITEDGDGILSAFGKEVKAPQVVGSYIGRELLASLKEHGWKNNLKVSMINDTVACLLAGAAASKKSKKYSSYIGFILGTGLNSAYIQAVQEKYPGMQKDQIVVCESGRFCGAPSLDFDISLDKKSDKPQTALMEKKCSGAYLGSVCLEALKSAANEGIFSKNVAEKILQIQKISLKDTDAFLNFPYSTEGVLGEVLSSSALPEDFTAVYEILDVLMDRAARLSTAILYANIVKCGKGKNPIEPVCILCNGTTFYKTFKVQQRINAYLEAILLPLGLYFETLEIENDITLGTAISGALKT